VLQITLNILVSVFVDVYKSGIMTASNTNTNFYRDLVSQAGNMAGHWYTTTMSWLEDWLQPGRTVGNRSDAARIAESLITELVQQGRLLEDKQHQMRRESMASRGVADYRYINSVAAADDTLLLTTHACQSCSLLK
jgi:hypothetical protein